jgi:valyl-tRNA synthetase
MLGTRFMGEAPFSRVFLNGLVRDEHGEKMSKTKGNDVDPLELVARHGTDAVRFTIVALAAPGVNPAFSESRLLGYRAFVNKLWNASRFLLMNLEGERAPSYERAQLPLPSRWILSRLQRLSGVVGEALGDYRFDRNADALYHFFWDEFCDWYIEAAKESLSDPQEAPRTRAVLLEVLDASLRLLHPVMPFVTEEIWQRLPHEGPSIMVAPFPLPDASKIDPVAEAEMERLMRLVTAIRTIRATYEVEPRKRIAVTIVARDDGDRAFVSDQKALLRRLATLESLEVVNEAADARGVIKQPVDGVEVRISMAGLFDIAAESARLTKERGKIDIELESLKKRLDNPSFVERAKPEVVSESRQRVTELEDRRQRIDATLDELGGVA